MKNCLWTGVDAKKTRFEMRYTLRKETEQKTMKNHEPIPGRPGLRETILRKSNVEVLGSKLLTQDRVKRRECTECSDANGLGKQQGTAARLNEEQKGRGCSH